MTKAVSTFSIVTPSFNQVNFIDEALSSVDKQKRTFVEHLVMDGASTDGTVDLLRRYSLTSSHSYLRWLSEPDRGQSHALNKGFDRASGEVVGWLNSDDRYRPGCFDCIEHIFKAHPDVDVVYGDYTWINESGDLQRVRREIEFSYFILLYHRVPYIPSTATFFRRRLLDEGNRLDEALQYAMDFEFFLRLAARGYRFLHVPFLLADFRFQPDSKTCTAPHKQLEEIDYIMRHYSPMLRRLRKSMSRWLVLTMLRSCAAALRYSEKLVRGYYFDNLRVPTLDR